MMDRVRSPEPMDFRISFSVVAELQRLLDNWETEVQASRGDVAGYVKEFGKSVNARAGSRSGRGISHRDRRHAQSKHRNPR